MSTVSLTVKPIAGDGTTSYVDGNYLPAAELQADLDALVNVINGNLDETNLDAGTQIPNSMLVEIAATKVGDFSDDDSQYAQTSAVGDSATTSRPTTIAGEVTRIRNRIAALRSYSTNVYYMDSGGSPQGASWIEPRPIGRNLLPNPGFELHSAGTPNAPDGWTLYSTPATVAIENPAHTGTGLEKRSLNIVTNGANEGIYTTVGGLKASTKYLVGMAYSITDNGTVAGTVGLYTANGLAAGAYQNLALTASTESAATVAVLNGIVKSTSTPDTMTIRIYATQSGADFNIHSVWMYELGESYPDELPAIPIQTASYATAADVTDAGSGTWTTLSSLNLSQYIPAPGYRLHFTASVCYAAKIEATMPETCDSGVRIQMDTDGGGYSTVQGPFTFRNYSVTGDNQLQFTNREFMHHIVENPTPGSTYSFHVDLGVYDGGANAADLVVNPDYSTNGMGQSRSESKLWLERK